MAHLLITMKNPNTGVEKKAPIGFSWTTLFFGPFPALFRGDITGGMIILVTAILTAGLMAFIWPFLYNKRHLKTLASKGFHIVGADKETIAIANAYAGIVLPKD